MKKYIFLLILLVGVFSCADLDDLAPINSIPTEAAIIDQSSAQAALNGVYSSLQDNDVDKWLALAQLFSDEAESTGTFPSYLEFGNFNVFPSNGSNTGSFTSFYTTINNANNVITLVSALSDPNFTQEAKDNIIGQAKFIRAQNYLQLVTLWEAVPLVLEPTEDVGEVLNIPSTAVNEIYTQIIADFTDAAQTILAETGPVVASKQAANAFLARIALYQNRWSDALSLSATVLGADFDLTGVPFLEDQIYSLGYTSADGNTLNFVYGPSELGGRYNLGPSEKIINAFEDGDLRFDQTLDLTTASVPFAIKYPSFDAGISGTATDPIFFIRHAELVLIAAEAAAEQGDFETASSYLNQVRARAGLAPVTLDASNYEAAILQERFVEFAFEGAFRLLDLRRRNQAEAVLGPLGYDTCDNIWPLPQRDVDRNPNLQQNDCCNC